MDPFATRRLGRTDLHLPVLGLGGTAIGGMYERLDEDTGVATVEHAWSLGIRYFDTAPYYGHGASERRYGAVLSERPRESFVLSTKVGRLLVPNDDGREKPAHWRDGEPLRAEFDYSPEGVARSLEGSRARLGIDRFDILFVHDAHDHVREALAGAWPALAAMRERGEVRAVGAGINWTEPCLALARGGDFDCFLLANRYTLLEQGPLDELFPYCQAHGIGIVAGGPFNSGILATGPVPGARYQYASAPPEVLERVRRIEAVCRRFDVPLAAAALQFPLGHPVVASVVCGARTPAEIEANVRLMAHEIPPELWAALAGEGLVRADAPVPG